MNQLLQDSLNLLIVTICVRNTWWVQKLTLNESSFEIQGRIWGKMLDLTRNIVERWSEKVRKTKANKTNSAIVDMQCWQALQFVFILVYV